MAGIKPEYQSLRDMINDEVYRIPDYQRGYSWGEHQCQDLLDDIDTMMDKKNSHFMSTIVCKKTEEKNGIKYFDLIDGQQRLTTLTILLKTFALQLDKEPEVNQFLNKTNGARLVKVNHQTSPDVFSKFIDHGTISESGVTISDKNLITAMKKCRDYVESSNHNKEEMLKEILDKLFFVRHTITDDQTAYTVFEVLNSRGLPVEWLDKCKALLIGTVFEKNLDNQVVDDVKKDFAKIFEQLNKTKVETDEIVRFASTLFDKTQTSKTLSAADGYDCFKKSLFDAQGDHASKIREISGLLKKTTSALVELCQNRMRQAVTKVVHARFLYVALMLKKEQDGYTGNFFKKLLQQWENVTFRIFGLAQRDARTKVGDYVKLAQRVYHGVDDKQESFTAERAAEDLIALGKNQAGEDEFAPKKVVEQIKGKDLYDENNWRDELLYFFYKYEIGLRAKNEQKWKVENDEELRDVIWGHQSADKTLEHIFPQNPENMLDWKPGFPYFRPNKLKLYSNRLGNLMLLNPSQNSSARNYSFDKKCKEVYEESTKLEMVAELLRDNNNKKSWGSEEIEKREKKLLEWAEKQWADVNFSEQ